MEVYVDDDSKLTLHGLQQHYVKLKDNEKNRKLFELLDALEFNQVIDSSLSLSLSLHIHCVTKKGATKLMAVTSSNLDRFSKFYHHWKEKEIYNKINILFPTAL